MQGGRRLRRGECGRHPRCGRSRHAGCLCLHEADGRRSAGGGSKAAAAWSPPPRQAQAQHQQPAASTCNHPHPHPLANQTSSKHPNRPPTHAGRHIHTSRPTTHTHQPTCKVVKVEIVLLHIPAAQLQVLPRLFTRRRPLRRRRRTPCRPLAVRQAIGTIIVLRSLCTAQGPAHRGEQSHCKACTLLPGGLQPAQARQALPLLPLPLLRPL